MVAQIHLNLCVGTIAPLAALRPDLMPLLDDLMAFRICASFLLTEFGHGLDVTNMETVATLLPDGSYNLHTPHPTGAKAMPPTAPLSSTPRIAIVVARLKVADEDRGLKLFLVPIASTKGMEPGVTAWMLPVRPGTTPLDHCLTSFHHVRLPPSALLGSTNRAVDPGLELQQQLWRVSVGAIALSLGNIACLKVAAYVAGTYSMRRLVEQAGRGRVPILSISTQYRPVLRALVAGEVLDAYANWVTPLFSNPELDILVRRGLAIVFKATTTHLFKIMPELAQRCGWRGFYPYAQLADLYLSYSANAVAEGDVHVLSLRLAYELLLKRYALPSAITPDSPLAQHEAGLLSDLEALFALTHSSANPESTFSTHGLPKCRALIVSMGQRMALEACQAHPSTVSPDVLYAFERISIAEDPAWYMENMSFSRHDIYDKETDAFEKLLPQMRPLLEKTGAKDFVTSPLVSENEWEETIRLFPKFSSEEPISKI
ncbi:hypothetical protein VHEMI04503 [[Torrubiella] hemipterigena]|nr:hypothetical protein VHEMI04503 [[Torrubiella] hemipterigena]